MTEIPNILPPGLRAILYENNDFYYDEEIAIDAITFLEKKALVNLSIYVQSDLASFVIHKWQLQIFNYRDAKIVLNNLLGNFKAYSEHPILWEFNDFQTELYFKNPATAPERLFCEMYRVHDNVFGSFIEVERFLQSADLWQSCHAAKGLYAKGPRNAMELYFKCLQDAGCEPYFLGNRIAKKSIETREGQISIPEDENLKVILLGGTYFVGTEFKFVQL